MHYAHQASYNPILSSSLANFFFSNYDVCLFSHVTLSKHIAHAFDCTGHPKSFGRTKLSLPRGHYHLV